MSPFQYQKFETISQPYNFEIRECLFIEIRSGGLGRNCIIGSIFRTPEDSILSFIHELNPIMIIWSQ